MSNDNEQQNFFDARTIMSVVLVGLTFVGWQWYMQKKYPNAMAKKTAAEQGGPAAPTGAESTHEKNSTIPNPDVKVSPKPMDPRAEIPEQIVEFTSENLSFEISNRGMGLKNLKLRKFKDRSGNLIELGHPEAEVLSLETRLLGHIEPLTFNIEKVNDRLFMGRASVSGLNVTKTLEVTPEKYLLNFKVEVSGANEKFVGLTTFLTEEVEIQDKGSILLPQFQVQEFFVNTGESENRVPFTKEDAQKTWNQARIGSIGSQYFTQAVVDKSAVIPEAQGRVDHARHFAELALQYSVLNKGEPFALSYQAFIGPKSHQLLGEVDERLAKVVDFGFFNWIGRHILLMLKWFFAMTGNWGWSIILLTICVRFMVLPFNIYSYKSMKAMQAIQPQIQGLREKYKDDQAKQQQEMMNLMRENRVNPLGGCLPVFLQFPIFIALYQVLGHSVELYQAPFILWLHDLSLKDPFYILPVLMGVTMFIQQKITPNTMDPAQAKVMLFMPILFTFFMFSLPSGLTLYMWVGAIFSVLQQLYFMRQGPLSSQRAK